MNEFLQGRLTINDRKESVEGGREGGRWKFTFPPNCNLAQNIVPYEIFYSAVEITLFFNHTFVIVVANAFKVVGIFSVVINIVL